MADWRVVLADDHRLLLRVMRLELESSGDFEVVGEARSGAQVLPLVGQTRPDLVVLDVEMPEMDGLTALRLLRKRHPDVKVVMTSELDEAGVIEAAAKGGAVGFIAKTVDPQELATSLLRAVTTPSFVTLGLPEEADSSRARAAGLSKREVGILRALAGGASNKQIANELWLAEQTVKFHLTNIYRKLGVGNRTDAVRYAYHHGLVASPMLDPHRDDERSR